MLSQIIIGAVYPNTAQAQDLSKVKPWQKVERIYDAVIGEQAYILQNGNIKSTSRLEGIFSHKNYFAIETRNSVYYVTR